MERSTQEDSSSREAARMMGLAWSCRSNRNATSPSATCRITCAAPHCVRSQGVCVLNDAVVADRQDPGQAGAWQLQGQCSTLLAPVAHAPFLERQDPHRCTVRRAGSGDTATARKRANRAQGAAPT